MSDPVAGEPAPQVTCQVLGLVAFTQLVAFGRLATTAQESPSLAVRQRMSRLAGQTLAAQERAVARLVELDCDPLAAMARFEHVFDDFEARTVASTWWEGVLKGIVGYPVVEDLSVLLAGGLAPQDGELIAAVVKPGDQEGRLATAVAEAAAADKKLASRLALWGRRLVGEALGVAQAVLTDPAFAQLIVDEHGAPCDQGMVFARLTAEHTRRMDALGLAA